MPPTNSLDPVLAAIEELKSQIHNNNAAPQERRQLAENFLDGVQALLKAYCKTQGFGPYYEWNYVTTGQGE